MSKAIIFNDPLSNTDQQRLCSMCGNLAPLEKKGKTKNGLQRYGSCCAECKAKKERIRYAKKVKAIKRRSYMLSYDVQKCEPAEVTHPSITPDGLICVLRDFAFSGFMTQEEPDGHIS